MSRRPVVPLSFTRHGDASSPAVILLQGLGMASNAWPAELVDALVETGLQVVLPDNRDAGKSPRVTGVRVRDVEVLGAVARTLARRKVSAAYDLDDMADDVGALERMLDRIEDTPLDMEATKRQLLAILASGNRSEALGQVRVPTLVIHGTADPLLPFAAGEETAAVIPGARLEPVEGMGHEVPAALGRRYAELIAGNTARAEPKAGA